MTGYIKRVSLFFALLALVPLLAGFAGPWSETGGAFLLVFGMPVALIALLVGTVIWVGRGARLVGPESGRRERVLAFGLAPALLVLWVLAILPLFVAGNFLGGFTRLSVNRERYEAIIALARKTPKSDMSGKYQGVTYSTDIGPPVRVLFNPEGARGMAGAIVYDPTGEMMRTKGWGDRTPFIIPVIACMPLSGDYYTCWFDW